MRILKPIVSLYMALLIGITSMGITVSAHACSASGFSETSLGHLKACCKLSDGHGFRAEPCCKVTAKHVKLATVRTAPVGPSLPCLPPALVTHPIDLRQLILAQHFPPNRSESPPILHCCDVLSRSCKLLI